MRERTNNAEEQTLAPKHVSEYS